MKANSRASCVVSGVTAKLGFPPTSIFHTVHHVDRRSFSLLSIIDDGDGFLDIVSSGLGRLDRAGIVVFVDNSLPVR
jgi:hypothetical protein